MRLCRVSCARKGTVVLLAVGLVCLGARNAHSQSEVAPERQVLVMTRALAYDDALKARVGNRELTIGILWKPGSAASEAMGVAMAKAFRTLERVRVSGLPVKVMQLAYTTAAVLEATVASHGIIVLYVCSGLENDLPAIIQLARKRKATTIGSREEHVIRGLSIGVFLVDSKPTIMVNLTASRSEGAVFSSDLLRLATVVK